VKKPPATLKPKKLYRWVTWHPQVDKAVAALSTPQLRVLNGYLARAGAHSGIPSLVHGLVLNVAAERLMLAPAHREENTKS
jgi:hypothetical protein